MLGNLIFNFKKEEGFLGDGKGCITIAPKLIFLFASWGRGGRGWGGGVKTNT